MGKRYSHFTESERIKLATLEEAGFSVSTISDKINKHRSTVYRELSGNISSSGYFSQKAHIKAVNRRGKS